MNDKIDKSIGETEDWFRGQCNQLYGTGFHPKYPGHENFFNPPYNTVLPGDSSGQGGIMSTGRTGRLPPRYETDPPEDDGGEMELWHRMRCNPNRMYAGVPGDTSIDEFCRQQAAWSQSVFGTDQERGPIGALKHLAKEAVEAQQKPDDIMEYVDCLFLTVDAARRAGFSWRTLLSAAWDKLEINRKRKWGKPTSDEPVEHVREVEP